jgi:O-acetylhomoserine/O-acetylserine sulfhydrylase-like pyridoxal-dependent enzyme
MTLVERMVDFASSEVNNSFNFGITGPINKANKVRQGIASLPPTLTRNPSKAEIKQNFIDQHPPVGSIDYQESMSHWKELLKLQKIYWEKFWCQLQEIALGLCLVE